MAAGERTIKIKFDGSAKGLTAETIKARAELKALEAQTESNREKFDKLTGPVGNAAKSFVALGQRLASLGTLTQVLPAIVSGIFTMAGALPLAVAGGFALAGVMATMKLGADGAKAAFSRLTPTLNTLKANVSASFESALNPAVNNLKVVLPKLTSGFQQIATAIGGVATRVTAMLKTSAATSQLQTILSGTARVVQNLGKFLAPVIAAFIRIGAVAMPILVQLTSGIGAAGDKFNAFVQHAADTGNLTQWINGAVNAFKSIFSVVKDLGSIVSSVFGAMQDAGGGLSGVLGPILGQVKTFLDSAQGHDTLVSLFRALQSVSQSFGQVFGAVLKAVAPAIPPLADAFARLASTVSAMLLPVITFLAPILQNVATFIQQNMTWITPLLIAIGLWTAAQWLLNIALNANPIGLVVLAIGVLIAIVATIITYWGPISGFFKGLWQGIVTAFNAAIDWIKNAFTTAVDWVKGVWGGISGWFSGLWAGITGGVSDAMSWVRQRFSDAWSFIKGVWGSVGSFFSGIWSGIGNGLKSALNGAIRIINGAIDGLNFIPGVNISHISYLARGGTAQAGQPYLVGERGPELFTPGQTGRVTSNAQTMGGAQEITLNLDLGEGIRQRIQIAIDENGRATARNVLAGIGGAR
jgi:phage-related protein